MFLVVAVNLILSFYPKDSVIFKTQNISQTQSAMTNALFLFYGANYPQKIKQISLELKHTFGINPLFPSELKKVGVDVLRDGFIFFSKSSSGFGFHPYSWRKVKQFAVKRKLKIVKMKDYAVLLFSGMDLPSSKDAFVKLADEKLKFSNFLIGEKPLEDMGFEIFKALAVSVSRDQRDIVVKAVAVPKIHFRCGKKTKSAVYYVPENPALILRLNPTSKELAGIFANLWSVKSVWDVNADKFGLPSSFSILNGTKEVIVAVYGGETGADFLAFFNHRSRRVSRRIVRGLAGWAGKEINSRRTKDKLYSFFAFNEPFYRLQFSGGGELVWGVVGRGFVVGNDKERILEFTKNYYKDRKQVRYQLPSDFRTAVDRKNLVLAYVNVPRMSDAFKEVNQISGLEHIVSEVFAENGVLIATVKFRQLENLRMFLKQRERRGSR